jgi:serine/threonine protein kinase
MKGLVHENILGLKDVIYVPKAGEVLGDIYLVSELMETDLNRVIKSKQKLKMEHIQYFIYQVLKAFKYIHSADIIHRDLKPSNILLNENCDLKIW